MSYQQLYTYAATHSYETVLILGLIAVVTILYKYNVRLSSVAFFDPLTKWGNKRFLDEVFLPQLLLEAYVEAKGDDKDEAIHFIEARITKIENLRKAEQSILVRLLTANIKKYLLHPTDQCFRIDNGIFRIIITRKKVSREESDQFLQNIQVAMDDLILIYPALEGIVLTNMLSWAELAEDTLDEVLRMSFEHVEENEIDKETIEAASALVWVPNILRHVLHKKDQRAYPQVYS